VARIAKKNPQNPITCSLGHVRHLQKISSKSVRKFSSTLSDGQTDKQTDRLGWKHNLIPSVEVINGLLDAYNMPPL